MLLSRRSKIPNQFSLAAWQKNRALCDLVLCVNIKQTLLGIFTMQFSKLFKYGVGPALDVLFTLASAGVKNFFLPKRFVNRILSEEEKVLLRKKLDDWQRMTLDTAPIDEARAQAAIEKLYTTAGFAKPKQILFLREGEKLDLAKILAEKNTGKYIDYREHRDFWDRLFPVWRSLTFMIRHYGPDFDKLNGLDEEEAGRSFLDDQGFVSAMAWMVEKTFSAHYDVAGEKINYFSGRHFYSWVAIMEFSQEIGMSLPKSLAPYVEAATECLRECGWFFVYGEDVVIIAGRPRQIHYDDETRQFHNTQEAAFILKGDMKHYYYLRGREVPEQVILEPEKINFSFIRGQDNVEVRRVIIDHIGIMAFLKMSRAVKLHDDKTGTLWRVLLAPETREWDESCQEEWIEPADIWQAVEVRNSTAEPDGSFNTYFLQVPADISTARQAVAWTFGMSEQEYNPQTET